MRERSGRRLDAAASESKKTSGSSLDLAVFEEKLPTANSTFDGNVPWKNQASLGHGESNFDK